MRLSPIFQDVPDPDLFHAGCDKIGSCRRSSLRVHISTHKRRSTPLFLGSSLFPLPPPSFLSFSLSDGKQHRVTVSAGELPARRHPLSLISQVTRVVVMETDSQLAEKPRAIRCRRGRYVSEKAHRAHVKSPLAHYGRGPTDYQALVSTGSPFLMIPLRFS